VLKTFNWPVRPPGYAGIAEDDYSLVQEEVNTYNEAVQRMMYPYLRGNQRRVDGQPEV
jgi:hypothetical protein